MSVLDLASMRHALRSLRGALATLEAPTWPALDPVMQETLRAGVIQNFEFCFELSVRMLARGLRRDTEDAGIVAMPWRNMVRLGAERGLVNDPRRWFEYRDMRNITLHTYDRAKADRVLAVVPAFLADAEELLAALELGNDG